MMKPSEKKQYLPPVADIRIEQIEGVVLEVQMEACFAEERDVLEEISRTTLQAKERMTELQLGIERVKKGC